MSVPDTERLIMLAGIVGPRRIAADMPTGDFRDHVTALLTAGIEDVSVWRPTFDVQMDLTYLLVAREGGVADIDLLAQAWADGIPIEYAIEALRGDE